MKNDRYDTLSRIAKILMLHGSFKRNLGLIDGKMGIVLFFYHLSKYLDKNIYEDFAGELIDEIYKEIHNEKLIYFRDGLCGIAWGMEYLIRNKFVEADANKVLVDLDKKIFEWDVRRITNYSLDTGLEGIAHYIISRCTGKQKNDIIIPRDYISEVSTVLDKNPNSRNSKTNRALKKILSGDYYNEDSPLLLTFISKIKFQKTNIFEDTRPLGIGNNGYAGIGLNLILIDK